MSWRDALRRLAPRGAKLFVARALTMPLIGRLALCLGGGTISKYGLKFKLSDSRSAAALVFGLYERAEIDLIRSFLPSDRDVIELGGSSGGSTALIARRLDVGRRVVSVEASPRLAELLKLNLKSNGIGNVTVVNAAVAYGAGREVQFSTADGAIAGRIVSGRGDAMSGVIAVPALTLAEIVERHALEDFTLVADIEGAEVPLFLAERTAFRRCRRVIIELDGGQTAQGYYSPDDVEALVERSGFSRVYRDGNCGVYDRII